MHSLIAMRAFHSSALAHETFELLWKQTASERECSSKKHGMQHELMLTPGLAMLCQEKQWLTKARTSSVDIQAKARLAGAYIRSCTASDNACHEEAGSRGCSEHASRSLPKVRSLETRGNPHKFSAIVVGALPWLPGDCHCCMLLTVLVLVTTCC